MRWPSAIGIGLLVAFATIVAGLLLFVLPTGQALVT